MTNFADRTIWTGDNLDILRGLNSPSVDLIYLDPPFNSNRNYAKTTTYGELGLRTNDIARNLSPRHLDPIYRYCEDRKLPRLAVLGVSQGSGDPGMPGDSYPGPRETIAADREEVFGYDWFNVAPPTVDELSQFRN